jgi:hypothetical protein
MGDYTPIPSPPADPVATASAQPDSPTLDPNRPVSTIPADSPQASPSAQPADLSAIASAKVDSVDQVFEATASAEITPPADSIVTASASADPQPAVPVTSDTPAQVVSPTQVEPQSPPVAIPVEPPKENGIQDQSSSNQPPQVQPEVPKNSPVVQVENTPSQSAGIKPEPPQGTQNAPSADIKLPESPKSSFGDLMGTPADLSEEPAIHIDPIEAPQEASPLSDQPQNDASAIRRQHAVEARKQKREENLLQVIELVQKKGTVDNLDVRDFLHISQTTATDYLRSLVNSGKLRKEGKARATKYVL